MVGHGQPLLRYFYPSQKRALAKLLCDQTRGRIMYIRQVMHGTIGCSLFTFNAKKYYVLVFYH